MRTCLPVVATAMWCWLLPPNCARAQPQLEGSSGAPEISAKQQAEALITEALKLRRRGDDAGALLKLQRAVELHATPRAIAQVAMAELALGQWLDAEAHTLKALAAADDPWIKKRRRVLETVLRTAGDHLGGLQIVDTPDGATVWVDDRRAGQTPRRRPFRVVADTVVVKLQAPEFHEKVRVVTVKAHSVVRLSMPMTPKDTALAAGAEPTPAAPAVAQATTPDDNAEVAGRGQQPEAASVARETQSRRAPKDAAAKPKRESVQEQRGVEVALHAGYHAFFDTTAGVFLPFPRSNSTTCSGGFGLHMAFGYRPVAWLSFGGQFTGSLANGDQDLWAQEESTASFRSIAPGAYARGHMGDTLLPPNFDVWLAAGFSPWSWWRVEATEDGEAVEQRYDVSGFSIPVQLGGTYFMTGALGLDVFFGTDIWIPHRYCYRYRDRVAHESADLCFEDLEVEPTWLAAAGLSLLLQ